jgi:hypothetical protein
VNDTPLARSGRTLYVADRGRALSEMVLRNRAQNRTLAQHEIRPAGRREAEMFLWFGRGDRPAERGVRAVARLNEIGSRKVVEVRAETGDVLGEFGRMGKFWAVTL